MLRKKIMIGLILCIFMFSSSIPVLLKIGLIPQQTFGGEGIIVLTQADTNTPLNLTLVSELRKQDFVETVSPEIYVFSVINNEPIMVRGVEPKPFLKIEDAECKETKFNDKFALIGEGLAKRFNLGINDTFVLTGSIVPAIMELPITGIYSTATPSNDELLVPLQTARKLISLGENNVLAIRIETSDRNELIDFLERGEYKIVVGDAAGNSILLNDNGFEEAASSLGIRYTMFGKIEAMNGSYTSVIVQKSAANVRVVIFGFILLEVALTFIGIAAILNRAVIEKKRDIGVLTAIGANKANIHFLLLKDLLKISIVSSIIGVIFGYIGVEIVKHLNLIVILGHSIQPVISPIFILEILVVTILLSCSCGLIVNERLLSSEPHQLMQEIDSSAENEISLEKMLEGL